jgi:hypothetical protein
VRFAPFSHPHQHRRLHFRSREGPPSFLLRNRPPPAPAPPHRPSAVLGSTSPLPPEQAARLSPSCTPSPTICHPRLNWCFVNDLFLLFLLFHFILKIIINCFSINRAVVSALQARGACVGLLSSARLYATGKMANPTTTYPHSFEEGISGLWVAMDGWVHLKNSSAPCWLHHQIGFECSLPLCTHREQNTFVVLCCVEGYRKCQLCPLLSSIFLFRIFHTTTPPPHHKQKRMMMVHNPRVGLLETGVPPSFSFVACGLPREKGALQIN